MPPRVRIRRLLVLVLALALAPSSLARADPAYDRVSAAFAQGGGTLDACAFTRTELEAAQANIPKAVAKFVPDLRRAIRAGIQAHKRGDCKGRKPGTVTTPTSPAGGVSPPPETSTPTTTPTAPAVPGATAPVTPTTIAPSGAPATSPAPQPLVTPAARHRDRTAVAVALVALGALLLLALLLWAWARARGWDPGWAARARHAWGEAGYRTTTTWSEFTDWLRLGR